jgi:hypothetical protein
MTDQKRSQIAKAIWAKFTPEQKSARMSAVVKARHKKYTAKQRSENARKLSLARWSKTKMTFPQV